MQVLLSYMRKLVWLVMDGEARVVST